MNDAGARRFLGMCGGFLCCFGYAAYILWSWPDPPPDPRLADLMAAITSKSAAAFTVLSGMFLALLAFVVRVVAEDRKKKPRRGRG